MIHFANDLFVFLFQIGYVNKFSFRILLRYFAQKLTANGPGPLLLLLAAGLAVIVVQVLLSLQRNHWPGLLLPIGLGLDTQIAVLYAAVRINIVPLWLLLPFLIGLFAFGLVLVLLLLGVYKVLRSTRRSAC